MRNLLTPRFLLTLIGIIALSAAVAPVALSRWETGREPAGSAEPNQEASQTPAAASAEIRAAPAASSPAASTQPERHVTLTPIGHLNPGDAGFHGDIWEHNGFAYLGTWGSGSVCPASGVKVIDLSDPAVPQWVSTLAAIRGTTQEDIVVRSIDTPAFRGDLLAVGIQSCTFQTPGGLALYDVTNPRAPVELGFLPSGARGVHELDLIQQGDRALALLAVPFSEGQRGGGDFRIVDVSDPRRPTQIASWGAGSGLGIDLSGGIGCRQSIYAHSARASADGRLVYLSYWDAGVIVLDITDPTRPRPAGHLTYERHEAGTTHSVAEAADGRYLLIADEEVVFGTPPGLAFSVQTGNGPLSVHGCEARFSTPLDAAGVIEAELVNAGRACPGTPLRNDVRGRVAVVEEGGCTPAEKAARLASDGARAMIAGVPGEAGSEPGGNRASIPVVIVGEGDARAIREAAGAGPVPVTLPSERPWGGLRIWDISDLDNPHQISTYQTPNSVRFPAPDDGYYTIHNPEVAGDLAVLSWWSDGVRVVDISDPSAPVEAAAYVPPPERNPQRAIFPDGTMVWGVAIAGDLVLLSDVNSGLHVLRLTVGG